MVLERLPHHRRIPETGQTGSGHEPPEDHAGIFCTAGRTFLRARVEDIAVRVLSSREYEDYAAVQAAINTAQTWRDGADVLEIVRLHAWIWPRESLESAARRVHVSQSTAKRMYSRFVYEAARELGYRKN